MSLTSDQQHSLAMKMLGIVERLLCARPPENTTQLIVQKPVTEDNGYDEQLNAIIREQLKSSDSDLMNSEE